MIPVRILSSVGEFLGESADIRPPTASMRLLYEEKVWLDRTGAISVWSSGDGSKRVSRALNCSSCDRAGSDEIEGRLGDMKIDVAVFNTFAGTYANRNPDFDMNREGSWRAAFVINTGTNISPASGVSERLFLLTETESSRMD